MQAVPDFGEAASALDQERPGVAHTTLADGDHRQSTEQRGLHGSVAERSRPQQVLLVQRPRAFELTGSGVREGKRARRPEDRVLVADAAEELDALFE